MSRPCSAFCVDESPRITAHPQELKNVVLNQCVSFTVQATGTEPLSYQWELLAENGSEGWQLCDVERFPGANSPTLTIPNMQRSNEASYHCVISNTVGRQTSEPVELSIGKT